MKIYSETSYSFILKAEKWLKTIIKDETELILRKTRFRYKGHTYPIEIAIITKTQTLGQFDPHRYQICLHQNLMFQAKDEVIKNILRHELAHYICFIEYGATILPHGEEFKALCKSYNWGNEVSDAYLDLSKANEEIHHFKSEKILHKVKALMSLASSDNPHEAELATQKANQLLLKYNLNIEHISESEIYMTTLYEVKRRNAKIHAFYEILKYFLVKPVFIYGQNKVLLEVSGHIDNIELAKYIVDFLDREFDRLWKTSGLKGLRAKNSFFEGLAKGFSAKMEKNKETFSLPEQKALVKIEKDLELQVQRAYRRLSQTSNSRSFDSHAFAKGQEKGKHLNINSPIKNKTKNFLLGWRP